MKRTVAPAPDRGAAGSGRSLRLLRLIALFKLVKSLLLIAAALALLKLLAPGAADRFGEWVNSLPLAVERRMAERLLDVVLAHGPARVHLAADIALAFAGLFATESVGLWLGRYWGEYLTIAATACGLPVELWEIAHRPTPLAGAVLIANALILTYLLWRVRQTRPR